MEVDRKEEKRLLAAAKRFDQKALAQLHDLHYKAVYRYVSFRISPSETVEDLTHEVFARFLQALKRRKGPTDHIRNWLIGTASNVVNDYFRKLYRHEELEMNDEIPATGEQPDSVVEQTLREEALAQAIRRLTPDQQEVLALRYGAGHPIKAVAQMLNKSEGAIKMLQARAIAMLGEWLTEVEDAYGA